MGFMIFTSFDTVKKKKNYLFQMKITIVLTDNN